jgi:hypothetical protein
MQLYTCVHIQFVHKYIEQDTRNFPRILKTKIAGIKVVNFCPAMHEDYGWKA